MFKVDTKDIETIWAIFGAQRYKDSSFYLYVWSQLVMKIEGQLVQSYYQL